LEINKAWEYIEKWLLENAKPLYLYLQSPASEEQINKLEDKINMKIPEELKDLLKLHNGSDEHYVLGRWYLMDTLYIANEWKLNLKIRADKDFDEDFWKETWIPVLCDGAGNFIAVDVNDGTVVEACNDPYARSKVSENLSEWFSKIASDMKAGRYAVSDEGESLERLVN
jgi:cell wall assembly regulator SMI1